MDKHCLFYFFVKYSHLVIISRIVNYARRDRQPFHIKPCLIFGITSHEITDQFLNTLNIKVRIDTLNYYSESMAPNG